MFGPSGCAEPGAARWPPASRSRALTAGLGMLDVCAILGGHEENAKPSPRSSVRAQRNVWVSGEQESFPALPPSVTWASFQHGSVHGGELLKYLRVDNCINTKTR